MYPILDDLKIRGDKVRFTDKVELFIHTKGAIALPLTMEKRQSHTIAEPTLVIDSTSAQELMDDLWRCGLRPSEGSGSAGSLLATQKHLEDLRKIAFKKLGID